MGSSPTAGKAVLLYSSLHKILRHTVPCCRTHPLRNFSSISYIPGTMYLSFDTIRKKEADLNALVSEEKLKYEETRKFLDNAFRDGVLKTTGTDIDRILPPISRFAVPGSREAKKQSVITKLMSFFEKYFGLV